MLRTTGHARMVNLTTNSNSNKGDKIFNFTTTVPASTNSHASGKSKNPYFRILRIRSDVFFDADSESSDMALGKNPTLRCYRRIMLFSRSRDQCAANWCTNFN